MAETLFGENIGMDEYDPERAKGYVLSGVADSLKPNLQKARGSLSERGFGRYSAPTVEGNVMNPLLQTGAESVRRGLTDLFFKQKAEDRTAEMHPWQVKMAREQYMTSRKARHGGKVICTELYRQGLLPLSHIKADLKYLDKFVSCETHDNYLRWAIPFAEKLKVNKALSLAIFPLVYCWSSYMKARVYGKRIGIRAAIGYLVERAAMSYGKAYKRRVSHGVI